jgi:soluble lytic murein transglycosylase
MRKAVRLGALCALLSCATNAPNSQVPEPALLPPEQSLLPPEFSPQGPKDLKTLDYFYLKMLDSSSEPRVRWWVDYKRAALWSKDNPGLSCEKWAALGRDSRFPLRRLALAKAHEVCARLPEVPPKPTLEALDQEGMSERWLQGPVLDAKLADAIARQDSILQSDLLLEKSKVTVDVDLKLKLTTDALSIAEIAADGDRVKKLRLRVEKIAPRFKRHPRPVDWFAMAQDFRRARDFSNANLFYNKVVSYKKAPLKIKIQALRGQAMAAKNARDKDLHLALLKRIVRLSRPKGKKSKLWPIHYSAVLSYVRAIWTNGQGDDGYRFLESKVDFFNQRVDRGELFWVLGRMKEEKREYAKAVSWLERAESEPGKDLLFREKIHWYFAWNLRKLGRFPEAVTAFALGREQAATDFSKARFGYWRAQTLLQSDPSRRAEALESFAGLINEDPLGYYGLLAGRQTQSLIKKSKIIQASTTPMSKPSRFNGLLDVTTLEWLFAVDELSAAQEILDQASESLQKDKESNDETTWLDVFRSYARAGSYNRLYEQLGQIAPEQRQALLSRHPELLFPTPYNESVQAAAAQFSLPSELLFAIMRQESSFNTRARSPADAFGLMQLIPEVASRAASVVHVPFHQAEDLYSPEINIPIGAYHLRQLWDRFQGQFILTVASYNASEKSIQQWLTTRFDGDPVAFIEEIPFEETRGYIRLVLRNMIFYQLLRSPTGEIQFPEWVFDLKKEPSST